MARAGRTRRCILETAACVSLLWSANMADHPSIRLAVRSSMAFFSTKEAASSDASSASMPGAWDGTKSLSRF